MWGNPDTLFLSPAFIETSVGRMDTSPVLLMEVAGKSKEDLGERQADKPYETWLKKIAALSTDHGLIVKILKLTWFG